MAIKETSADHSWHLALLALVVCVELKINVDTDKSLKIAIVHDLVEAIAGDVDNSLIAFGKMTKEEKYAEELKAIKQLEQSLPLDSGKMIKELWHEYEEGKTKEARFIKALDKIETINHMLAIGTSCFDHPELIAPYPNKAVNNFPELRPVLKEIHKKLKEEYKKMGWPWKPEYEV